MQSLNGVYIDGKTIRIKPLTPTPLQTGCEICFGTIIPHNELKYRFLQTDNGSHVLLRIGADPPQDVKVIDNTPSVSSGDGTSPVTKNATPTPPLESSRDRTPPLDRQVTPPLTDETPPLKVKKPRLDVESPSVTCSKPASLPHSTNVQEPTTGLSVGAPSSGEVTVASRDSPLTPQPDSDFPPSTSGTTIHPTTSGSQSNTSASTTSKSACKPSPSLSLTSPASVIDDLFSDTAVEKMFDDIVSDAIFGEGGNSSTDKTVISGCPPHMDGTSIQIQAAKDELQREKQKLLSNIEALKSELSSKERLLVEKSEKEKVAEQKEGIIDSMQEEFTCVICQELFITAHTLTCSHSFCESCIREWMKVQKKKDCPICRKTITAEPVRSLVLDNAIDKMVEKMDDDAKEERKKLKESRTLTLNPATTSASRSRAGRSDVVHMLATASALGVLAFSAAAASSGTSASGGSGSGAGARGTGSSSSGRRGGRTTGSGSANSPIVLSADTPQRRHRHANDQYDEESDDESDDEDDSDDEDSYDSDASYDYGMPGYYYGGYGRCFKCGEFCIYKSELLYHIMQHTCSFRSSWTLGSRMSLLIV